MSLVESQVWFSSTNLVSSQMSWIVEKSKTQARLTVQLPTYSTPRKVKENYGKSEWVRIQTDISIKWSRDEKQSIDRLISQSDNLGNQISHHNPIPF